MEKTGPDLARLTGRLAATPADFLDEPKIGNSGRLVVAALVNDVVVNFGRRVNADELPPFESKTAKLDRNRLQLVAIATWLLMDEWFVQAKIAAEDILILLTDHLTDMAATHRADKFVTDSERREECVRVILARLHYRPAGETKAQAVDRLSALSSIERKRLLEESHAAEKRAREIREALVRKAAQESADKWTRE